jgi:hypothetical protein
MQETSGDARNSIVSYLPYIGGYMDTHFLLAVSRPDTNLAEFGLFR